MKKYVKVLSIVLVVALVAVFAACGVNNANKNNNDNNETTAPVENTGATYGKDGKLIMGTNAAFPPYEFVGDDGQITGIDAEIAKAVCEKLGFELEIKDMEFDSLVPAVAAGSIDFALAGMTVNDERKQSVDFSDPYANGVQVVIVPEGSDIKSVDNLTGKMVGVQAGTTGDIYCTDEYTQDFVKQYSNGALAVQALLNGQVDCVVIDNEPAKSFVAANDGLTILETEYANEDYAAAISKDNAALLADFNKALIELKADGTLDKIVEKFIPAE